MLLQLQDQDLVLQLLNLVYYKLLYQMLSDQRTRSYTRVSVRINYNTIIGILQKTVYVKMLSTAIFCKQSFDLL